MPKNHGGRYTDRTIGSKPVPKDPRTEQVRTTLTNPFGKKYGTKEGS